MRDDKQHRHQTHTHTESEGTKYNFTPPHKTSSHFFPKKKWNKNSTVKLCLHSLCSDAGNNITRILNAFFDSGYDKRVRPNYGGEFSSSIFYQNENFMNRPIKRSFLRKQTIKFTKIFST